MKLIIEKTRYKSTIKRTLIEILLLNLFYIFLYPQLFEEQQSKLLCLIFFHDLIEYIKRYYKEHHKEPPTSLMFYRVGKILGKGAFGKVSIGINKLVGSFVAIKSINKDLITNEASRTKIMRELSIWERLKNPSVIRLYEMFETEKHMLYVQEFCGAGDLLTYVRRRRRLKEPVARRIMRQILEGLHCCHSNGIVHRDVKLDNILLTSDGKIKICDFGVSRFINPGEKIMEQCGTPAYIAPEILRNKGYEGFSVDVWSAGVVLYAMIFGNVPFKASNMKDLHHLILAGKYSFKEEASEEVKDLIARMLEIDPVKRITIPQIMCHKWLSEDDPSLTLLSEEEKQAIEKEFNHPKRNEKIQESNNTLESDNFTEHNLEASMNEITRNISSKSHILAPFNSTISQEYESHESIEIITYPKKIVKLASKVRDIDRQYEKNNNCELDNGVYNKLMSESRESNHELNPFGSNDYKEEEKCRTPSEGIAKGTTTSSPRIKEEFVDYTKEEEEALKLSRLVNHPIVIDEEVIRVVETYGYPREHIITSLMESILNHVTSCYFLLVQK